MARILNSLPRKFTLKLNFKFAMPISIEEHQVATISKVKAKSLVPSGVVVKIYPLFWILIEGYLFKMINNVIKDGYNSKEVNKMVDYAFIWSKKEGKFWQLEIDCSPKSRIWNVTKGVATKALDYTNWGGGHWSNYILAS